MSRPDHPIFFFRPLESIFFSLVPTAVKGFSLINLQIFLLSYSRTAEFKAQKEAVWAITNLTSGGTIEQIATIANHGIVPILCDLLTVRDSKVNLDHLRSIMLALSSGNVKKPRKTGFFSRFWFKSGFFSRSGFFQKRLCATIKVVKTVTISSNKE